MSTPPTVVLAPRAEAPQASAIQPIVNDAVDVPTLGNPQDANPRMGLRRRRGRANDRLSLKLSEHEINEDIYALTGSVASHHPRRRPVPLQEMLNRLVPGAPLAGLTPETYPVHQEP
ncbi:unnamed protein product [Urochloa decumbens]|uniref:Uncharacterized protein n=1 Tax=Urochloa decumbens TaxID=240449 RepID=A0ABC9AXP4_9POAL